LFRDPHHDGLRPKIVQPLVQKLVAGAVIRHWC
jgi:hypothetical protein